MKRTILIYAAEGRFMARRNIATILAVALAFASPEIVKASELALPNQFNQTDNTIGEGNENPFFVTSLDEYLKRKEITQEENERNEQIYKEASNLMVLVSEKQRLIANKYIEAKQQASKYTNYAPAQESFHALGELKTKGNTWAKISKTCMSNIRKSSEPGMELEQLKKSSQKITDIAAEAQNVNISVDYFYGYYDVSEQRKKIVSTALSLSGKIPYSWGEKPNNPGWNEKWDNKTIGLDCSGFVQWTYWTVTGQYEESLGSTLMLTHTYKEIAHDELLPGDLGTITSDGSYYLDEFGNKSYQEDKAKELSKSLGGSGEVKTISNHVGIYVGKDKQGRDVWCHCKGEPENTVVVTNTDEFDKFGHYWSISSDEENKEISTSD